MTAKKSRATTREVLFTVNPQSEAPLYRQIYEQASAAIIAGTLAAGDKLPSIRSLAKTLGLSHITVEQAYLQLVVEGFVRNVARSGYLVEQLDTKFLQLSKPNDISANVKRALQSRNNDSFSHENTQGIQARWDFSYANLPANSFPANIWRKLANDVLYANNAPEFARYASNNTPNALQKNIANYLNRTRGLACLPEQVILQAGTEAALACLLELFDPKQHLIGIEEPGYATAIEVARRMGFTLVALPSNKGPEAFLHALEKHQPKIVFCTPSHQFPTGSVMHLDTRTKLLQWASAHNVYIIEDDSCNEYRYDTAPIPSLASLDAYTRVIYLCNISKVLSPSMRIAYMVLPPKLLGRYLHLFNYSHPAIPHLEQEVLARFMEEGYWDAHVRRMAKTMHKRHDVLLEALEAYFGDQARIEGKHAGMHLYVRIHNGMKQAELISRAQEAGVAVYGTRRMWFSRRKPTDDVMLGFSSIPLEDIPHGVEALKAAWFK